jgi:hypothetical protein
MDSVTLQLEAAGSSEKVELCLPTYTASYFRLPYYSPSWEHRDVLFKFVIFPVFLKEMLVKALRVRKIHKLLIIQRKWILENSEAVTCSSVQG